MIKILELLKFITGLEKYFLKNGIALFAWINITKNKFFHDIVKCVDAVMWKKKTKLKIVLFL